MKWIHLYCPAVALALAVGASLPSASAQIFVAQPAATNADRLAEEMRTLAASPKDLSALLAAGALSAKLGDDTAALAFFARAEAIDPSNPRIVAGRASVLVRGERPGEALRMFQAAEAAGLAPLNYASDRGFAYDLLGAPQLAQRDYRLALAQGSDDETVRRYALSLGITGKPEEAMAQIDILLRKGDRAAWRARAFILAMNGDVAGAEHIAATMMPTSMGAGLSPFFQRLGGLSVANRAFAVHFGELSPTPARLADLRQAPSVPAYVPEPKPVAVAAVAPPPVQPAATAKGKPRRSRSQQVASAVAPPPAQPAPVQVAEANPLPPPPAFVPPPPAPLVQPIPTPAPPPSRKPQRVAHANPPAPVPENKLSPATEDSYTLSESHAAPPPPTVEHPRPVPKPSARAHVQKDETTLASIVEGITIPPSELAALRTPTAAGDAKTETDSKPPKPGTKADPKTTAKGKAAAKQEPKKPDPKKLEPSRVWVQVAGGANAGSLPATWKKLVKQAPTIFRGKSAWTTPLRATNRLLVGPFDDSDDAQEFVNQLHKADMSGFAFTSDAGQKIVKLALK